QPRSEGEPEAVLLLRQRRRRHPGHPDAGLESRPDGAAREAARLLVRAVREAQSPQDIQLAPRSVRTGGRELEHLLGLGALARLYRLRDAGDRREADRGVRGFPSAPEAGRLQPRRGPENLAGGAKQRQPLTSPEDQGDRNPCARPASPTRGAGRQDPFRTRSSSTTTGCRPSSSWPATRTWSRS